MIGRLPPMNIERANQIEEMYQAVLEIAESEREAFLRRKCGADEDLRREVESLLSFDEVPSSVLDNSPESLIAEMFIEQDGKDDLIGRKIGRYKVERLLGKGGMGAVYLAEDVRLKRWVTLKFLSSTGADNQNLMRRFEREVFAASALNHPNILTVHDFITEEDMKIIVAEYIEGESLRDKMNGGQLPLNEVLRIIEQVASALSATHNAGIIHRDIKPENIMIRNDGIVKILDFGLAKLTEQAEENLDSEVKTKIRRLTVSGMVIGTPSYMSPEQVRGQKNINGQTDIWSLGVILYEMITGQIPFSGDTAGDRIASILKTDLPAVSRIMDDCPPEIESIIRKALAKNVRDRYQAIEGFALDIKHFRQRLDLEAELKRSNTADPLPQNISKETKDSDSDFFEASTKNFIKVAHTSVATEERATVKSRQLPVILVAALLVSLSIAGFIFWKNFAGGASNSKVSENSNLQTVPARPEREISYYLDVQKMRNGRPFEEPFRASGREVFESGYKFRMVLESDTDGFLYIFNEGKNEKGETEYYLLQPTSPEKDAARIKAKRKIQTAYNVFGGGKGTEIVWVIWTKNENEFIENAKKAAIEEGGGGIVNDNNSLLLNEFLLQHDKDDKKIDKESSKEVTTVKSTGDFIIHRIDLEHK
jgi:serine/threonine protein kinase